MTDIKTIVDGIRMTTQYTHSMNWGGYLDQDQDVYDCFLVRETDEVSLYGGLFNYKTLYVKGFHQAAAKSRRACGDSLTPPDILTVLEVVVSDAAAFDDATDFRDWASTFHSHVLIGEAENVMQQYQKQQRLRDELADFLGRDDWDVIAHHIDAVQASDQ